MRYCSPAICSSATWQKNSTSFDGILSRPQLTTQPCRPMRSMQQDSKITSTTALWSFEVMCVAQRITPVLHLAQLSMIWSMIDLQTMALDLVFWTNSKSSVCLDPNFTAFWTFVDYCPHTKPVEIVPGEDIVERQLEWLDG